MNVDPRNYKYANFLLKNRIIMVTGASDGIGKALALEVARLGAKVILHGRNKKKLENVYDQINIIDNTLCPSIALLDMSNANAKSYTTLANSIENEFGRLDGLVHNAAVLGDRFPIEHYDVVMWQKVMHVNVTAGFALTQVMLPALRQSCDSSIIFTSSGVGRIGKAYWGAYASSKFAIEGLSQVLADEHRHSKLRSNCVNPGATRTNMRLEAFPGEDRDTLKAAKEILNPYIYLLGPDSIGVTGKTFDAQY